MPEFLKEGVRGLNCICLPHPHPHPKYLRVLTLLHVHCLERGSLQIN